MEFSYEVTEKEVKREVVKKYNRSNVFYFVLFTALYLFTVFSSKSNDKDYLRILGVYMLTTGSLLLVMYLFNKLFTHLSLKYIEKDSSKLHGIYKYELSKTLIKEDFNGSKRVIKLKDVDYIRFRKNEIIIRFDNNTTEYSILRSFVGDNKLFNEVKKYMFEMYADKLRK